MPSLKGRFLVSTAFQVYVYHQHQLVFQQEFSGPVELGRQQRDEPGPYHVRWHEGRDRPPACWRVVIGGQKETLISRHHVLVEPLADGRARLTNRSDRQPVRLGHRSLAPLTDIEATLPALLVVGDKTVRVELPDVTEPDLEPLPERTMSPARLATTSMRFPGLTLAGLTRVDTESLVRWLQTVMGVLQGAAGASDFFQTSAQAVVDIAALDSGAVLMWQGDEWQLMARRTAVGIPADEEWWPSHRLLNQVKLEKRTFRQLPPRGQALELGSMANLQAVLAAPILDRLGEVIGVLYGDRRHQGGVAPAPQIGQTEALLIETVACGVAAGLARQEQEQAALAALVKFEQFFPPGLARRLLAEPEMLVGRAADVTVLFCDIRGFSRISGRVGSALTVEWIGHVMGVLSDCVIERNGVVVDYVGDELIAMWGAPEPQPDQAVRACQAALDMLEKVPELNTRWAAELGEAMDVGIGINSGLAHVGNIGSHRRFKYGPLGSTVNIASRVQGVNKFVHTRLLAAGPTCAQLERDLPLRRVCRARLVNIEEPVDLHELASVDQPGFERLAQQYQAALLAFEAQELTQAVRLLEELAAAFPADGPTRELLARTKAALAAPAGCFNPVWEFTSK